MIFGERWQVTLKNGDVEIFPHAVGRPFRDGADYVVDFFGPSEKSPYLVPRRKRFRFFDVKEIIALPPKGDSGLHEG